MPIRRQRIDMGPLDVQRKCPHPLNRIHKEEAPPPPADLADRIKVRPVTGEVLDKTDCQQPHARASGVDRLQRIFHGEPLNPHASLF